MRFYNVNSRTNFLKLIFMYILESILINFNHQKFISKFYEIGPGMMCIISYYVGETCLPAFSTVTFQFFAALCQGWTVSQYCAQINTRDTRICAILIPAWDSIWWSSGFSHNQNNSSSVCVTCMYCSMRVKTNTCKTQHSAQRLWTHLFCVCFCVFGRQNPEDPQIEPNGWQCQYTGRYRSLVSLVYICCVVVYWSRKVATFLIEEISVAVYTSLNVANTIYNS